MYIILFNPHENKLLLQIVKIKILTGYTSCPKTHTVRAGGAGILTGATLSLDSCSQPPRHESPEAHFCATLYLLGASRGKQVGLENSLYLVSPKV